MACCLQLLVYLKAKDWLTISLFSHRTPQVFFKSCCCYDLKTGNKRITNLSFISLHCVDEKNIFTDRKPVTLYVQNKLHENTALVAGNILFFLSFQVAEENKLFSFAWSEQESNCHCFWRFKTEIDHAIDISCEVKKKPGTTYTFAFWTYKTCKRKAK